MASKINSFKHLCIAIIAVTLVFANANTSFAAVSAKDSIAKASPEKPAFNASEFIMGHVKDNHEWHIAGDIAIPLPVILYSPAGLDIFLSSKLGEGKIYKGKQNYKLEGSKIVVINDAGTFDAAATNKLFDISVTKNVVALFISLFLILWVFISVANSYVRNKGKAPKGLQSFIEPLVIFVRDDIAKTAIGEKKHEKYLPYILTVFFFIWINNLIGMIPVFPGGANLTGNIAITFTLAILTLIITLASSKKHYWHHIFAMPGVPVWVLIILTPIEIVGIFLKPFVLMIRLFANILAGHIVAMSFFCLIFIFANLYHSTGAGYGVSVVSILFTVFMSFLDLLEGFIQAYVFALLTAMYIGMALQEDHHHEEEFYEMEKVIA
ncbi:MAG: F0F1 ATP synthase subunit A [Bacteroidia bacterium]